MKQLLVIAIVSMSLSSFASAQEINRTLKVSDAIEFALNLAPVKSHVNDRNSSEITNINSRVISVDGWDAQSYDILIEVTQLDKDQNTQICFISVGVFGLIPLEKDKPTLYKISTGTDVTRTCRNAGSGMVYQGKVFGYKEPIYQEK